MRDSTQSEKGYFLTKERRENRDYSHPEIESNSSKIRCFSILTFPRMRVRNSPLIIGSSLEQNETMDAALPDVFRLIEVRWGFPRAELSNGRFRSFSRGDPRDPRSPLYENFRGRIATASSSFLRASHVFMSRRESKRRPFKSSSYREEARDMNVSFRGKNMKIFEKNLNFNERNARNQFSFDREV